ncbi:DUF3987 domain-containing protein [Polaribacter sp. IC066]|uniref:DUF3987 domain-containing protein n=1 Tax=Polaribacter sp. IC066 TaxID=57032 RepID=UPI0011BEACF3|nr:DUF3987 domain-containing protein [Polaribacter sp. IC066]TXD56913.1 DUF3987 domain-containing protein [Polaribacter sp. IC066]
MNKTISVFSNFVNKVKDIPLEEILNDIKTGTYKAEISNIRDLINSDEKEQADKLKKQLLAFTVSGTCNNGRSVDKLETYSQYVILDIDKLSISQLKEIINLSRLAPYTYASFVSPSGKGLKIIVKINTSKEHHKEAYKQVVDYYEQTFNIEIDTSGSDICRLCFMSFDEDCFINPTATTFAVNTKPIEVEIPLEKVKPSKEVKSIKTGNSSIIKIETYIAEIEKTATDITDNYKEWVKIGFAISEEYGETGRDYFHRISKFHPNYNAQECDIQYTKCINGKSSGVSISTFYYLAHQNNINIIKIETEEETEMPKDDIENIEESKSPTFSTPLIPQLPQLLQDMLKHTKSDYEQDLMILGTITTLSACLPNLYGIYDGDKIYPNLYLFVSAPAASGKGKIKFCKRLVDLIHDKLQNETNLLKEKYDRDLALYNKNKAKDENIKKPKIPPFRMLFIPANNSSSGMFQLLNDNNGKGLIFETEADTLAKNFTKDYGDYSDGFRNAFHHEPIKYYRKTDREYVEMKEPGLSCVLTGTPKQVLALMPSAENGLFSRFMFYQMPGNTKWRNVFEIKTKNGLNDYFDLLGKEFFALYESLNRGKPIQFSYTEEQQKEFLDVFPKLNVYYLNINHIEYDATVKRLGIIAFRISMIFTALRILENGDISTPLYCLDEDFQSTITIIKVLIKHSSKVYSSLPKDESAITYKNKKEQFIESLPIRFTTQMFKDNAIKYKIAEKSAERYITKLCKDTILVRESQGNYYNPSKEDK